MKNIFCEILTLQSIYCIVLLLLPDKGDGNKAKNSANFASNSVSKTAATCDCPSTGFKGPVQMCGEELNKNVTSNRCNGNGIYTCSGPGNAAVFDRSCNTCIPGFNTNKDVNCRTTGNSEDCSYPQRTRMCKQ